MIVAIAAISGFRLWSQYVRQAYLQSAKKLMREVYIKPNMHDGRAHVKMDNGQLLKFLKPRYGFTDSGDYWYNTFANHIKKDLNRTPTAGDLSLFFETINGNLVGLTGAYVDDSIGTDDESFELISRLTQQKFDFKAYEHDNFKFAGIQIEHMDDGYLLHQEKYAMSLKPLKMDCTFRNFRSRRHELAWLKHTGLDLCAAINLLAQMKEAKFQRQHLKQTKRVITRAQVAPKRGVRQQRLDQSTLRIKVFTDSSFENAEGNKLQLGFVFLLCESSSKYNILHSSSYKIQRVVRSVLGGETYAFANGFDFAYLMRHIMQSMIGTKIPLTTITDSEKVFKVIVKSTITTEKRLMIDVEDAREV